MKATEQLAVLPCDAVYYAVQGGYKPGRVLNKVIYGEAPPRGFKPLLFNMLIFAKMVPLSYTSRISQNNKISYDRHRFPKTPSFEVLRVVISAKIWHSALANISIHFAADFVTISHTKMTIFHTL